MVAFSITLSYLKDVALLELDDPEGRPVKLPLPTASVDKVLRYLAHARAQMRPAVPAEPDPDAEGPRIDRAPVQVVIDPATRQPALRFRHPALGWTTMVLAADEAARLADELGARARWSMGGG
jgi:hypothetical protein